MESKNIGWSFGTTVPVSFKRIRSYAALPRYMTDGAAGMDCYAACETPIALAPFERRLVPLGFALELPRGLVASIRPRSGLSSKGIWVAYGTVDSDYRGEVAACMKNLTDMPFVINPGDRIAQMVISPVITIVPVEVNELSDTVRGDGGFGSTGTRG